MGNKSSSHTSKSFKGKLKQLTEISETDIIRETRFKKEFKNHLKHNPFSKSYFKNYAKMGYDKITIIKMNREKLFSTFYKITVNYFTDYLYHSNTDNYYLIYNILMDELEKHLIKNGIIKDNRYLYLNIIIETNEKTAEIYFSWENNYNKNKFITQLQNLSKTFYLNKENEVQLYNDIKYIYRLNYFKEYAQNGLTGTNIAQIYYNKDNDNYTIYIFCEYQLQQHTFTSQTNNLDKIIEVVISKIKYLLKQKNIKLDFDIQKNKNSKYTYIYLTWER